jgi:glucose-6-phosphate 1-dehydrogenase
VIHRNVPLTETGRLRLARCVVDQGFLNRVFEPLLNATHVERVDISWLESLTLEWRASYYDTAGAMKDMLQTHLMEAMALVVMKPPARIDANSFRAVRVEALRSVATPSAATMTRHTVRARYAAGSIGSRQVPSYVDEPGVDPGRKSETYASLTVDVNSTRWAGVPFTMRSGKAMPADSAEIAIPRHAGLRARPVARRRAERAPARSHRPVGAAGDHAQRPGADRGRRRTRGPLDAAPVPGVRPPDRADAAEVGR